MDRRAERSQPQGDQTAVPPATTGPTPRCEVPVDLFAEVLYERLRGGAAYALRQELRRSGRPQWGGTSLVHDAYIRIRQGQLSCPEGVDQERYCWGAFVIAMRRILVERARRRLAGATLEAGPLDAAVEPLAGVDEPEPEQTLRMERALRLLLAESAALHEVFALRHFAGLSREEIARLRASRVEEVKRQLEVARTRLRVLIESGDSDDFGEPDGRRSRSASVARPAEEARHAQR